MFDEETQQALSRLSEADLTKVGFMIKKLAKKSSVIKQDKPKQDNFHVQSSSKKNRSPVVEDGQRPNLFLQMAEFNEHKEDVEIDKQLSRFPPTPRNRKTTLVEVTCAGCGKTKSVASALIPAEKSRYLCNDCQVRGARG